METKPQSREAFGQGEEPYDNWHASLTGLRECVCELLIKNQQLRMELMTQKSSKEDKSART
jgi:hypothetical protein